MKRQRKTAAELMDELNRDQEYCARRASSVQRLQQAEERHAELWQPYLAELGRRGFPGETLPEIVLNHTPLPPTAIAVILDAVTALQDDRMKETAVRALGASDRPFDGTTLESTYNATSDEGLRWAILNTIALTNPSCIADWLRSMRGTVAGETLANLKSHQT